MRPTDHRGWAFLCVWPNMTKHSVGLMRTTPSGGTRCFGTKRKMLNCSRGDWPTSSCTSDPSTLQATRANLKSNPTGSAIGEDPPPSRCWQRPSHPRRDRKLGMEVLSTCPLYTQTTLIAALAHFTSSIGAASTPRTQHPPILTRATSAAPHRNATRGCVIFAMIPTTHGRGGGMVVVNEVVIWPHTVSVSSLSFLIMSVASQPGIHSFILLKRPQARRS